MHRALLLRLVESYQIKYPAEIETISRYKGFVTANKKLLRKISFRRSHHLWRLDIRRIRKKDTPHPSP